MPKSKFIIFSLFSLLLPLSLDASTLVEAKVGRENINAIEGILVLPAGASVEKIYTGNSAVLIWITEPLWDAVNRTISFAGLSPGGFSGTAPLFTLELSSGEARIAGGRLTGYRNDGEGTAIELEYSLQSKEGTLDNEAPEPFRLTMAHSPEVFEDNHFVTFTTQDKNTGVDRYEYRSTWFFTPEADDGWVKVTSPLVLSKKESFQRIHVRAVDHAGNYLRVSTAGPYWPITLAIGLIIIVCVALFITRSLSLPASPSLPQ